MVTLTGAVSSGDNESLSRVNSREARSYRQLFRKIFAIKGSREIGLHLERLIRMRIIFKIWDIVTC